MAIAKAKGRKKQPRHARVRTPIADANAEYRAGFKAWAKRDAARSAKPATTAAVQSIELENLPEGIALSRANHALRAALDAAVQTYALLANRAIKNAEQVINRGDGPRPTLHAQLVRLLPVTLAKLQRLTVELEDALGIYSSLRIDTGAPASAKRGRPATKKGLRTLIAAVLQEIPDEVSSPAELVAWLRKHGHKVTRQEVDAVAAAVRKRGDGAARSGR